VDIQMRHLQGLLAERRIGLELTEAARQHLADEGFDPVYGARPLKRVIQREVQDPLALALLRGEFREGDTVRVDARDGGIVFGK
jgi:ATP-dependent Clp protease ATP-binding subunit ClpB